MPPSVQTLQKLAGQTALQAGTLEKVIRLLDLLAEIAADPVLKDRVALKGGTALNVFYLKLDRLSVDIDLNYIGALDREAMLAERPEKPSWRRSWRPRGTGCADCLSPTAAANGWRATPRRLAAAPRSRST